MIHEFFVILESGALLFHRQYRSSDNTDVALRAGYISALHSFIATVEHDSIDFIQMKKTSVVFKKTENFIFVLFVDSTISPALCRDEFRALQEKFFECFPEILWNHEIINLTMFKPFTQEADLILLPLGKKLEFVSLLLSDGLISENDFLDNDFESLGSIVGTKLLEKTNEQFSFMASQEEFLENVDYLLERFERTHIERKETLYQLDCVKCTLCLTERTNCFFEGFISVVLSAVDMEPYFSTQPHQDCVVSDSS